MIDARLRDLALIFVKKHSYFASLEEAMFEDLLVLLELAQQTDQDQTKETP